jgi:hypothetical protein
MWVQILVESFQDFGGTRHPSNPSARYVQRQQDGAWGFHSLAFERAAVVESDAAMEIAVSEARMVDNGLPREDFTQRSMLCESGCKR